MLARLEVEGDRQVVASRRPVAAIVAKSEEIDAGLIVAGSHGHSGIFRMTLGSVAERVLSQARCSVLAAAMASDMCSGSTCPLARVRIRKKRAEMSFAARGSGPRGGGICR